MRGLTQWTERPLKFQWVSLSTVKLFLINAVASNNSSVKHGQKCQTWFGSIFRIIWLRQLLGNLYFHRSDTHSQLLKKRSTSRWASTVFFKSKARNIYLTKKTERALFRKK